MHNEVQGFQRIIYLYLFLLQLLKQTVTLFQHSSLLLLLELRFGVTRSFEGISHKN